MITRGNEVIVILTKKVVTKDLPEFQKIKELYFQAFPAEERVPWSWLYHQSKKQFIEFIAFYDQDEFVGIAYNVTQKDLTYIFYLAVDPQIRGGGYGGKILADLAKMYQGQRFCLSAEAPDSEADNNETRLRRIAFYQRNGFELSHKTALEKGVKYTMMHRNGNFENAEYQKIIAYFAGFFKFIFKVEFIDENK